MHIKCHKFGGYIFFLTYIAALLSCAGTKVVPKPQKDIIQYNQIIAHYNRLHNADIVSHHPLPAQVKKVLVQYNVSGETPPANDELLLWNQAIQKTLLRNGFLIVQKTSDDDIFNEENVIPQFDALCIIDNINILKHSDTVLCESPEQNTGFKHQYSYYSACISASIAINQTILWRGDVHITSFDVLISNHTIKEPVLYVTISSDYSYSKKLNKWIKDQPEVTVTDNFSTYVTGNNISHHKKELVQLATSILFDTVKVAQ